MILTQLTSNLVQVYHWQIFFLDILLCPGIMQISLRKQESDRFAGIFDTRKERMVKREIVLLLSF